MNRTLKRRLMIGVAVVAVLAGGSTAVVMAAQPASHHRTGGALGAAAAYLGSSPTQLRSELQSGKSLAQIANATSGKSEAGLIAALDAAFKEKLVADAANLPSRITAEVDRIGLPAGRRGRAGGSGLAGRRHAGRGRALTAAASYLGISTAQLRGDLRSGRTLVQVANATAGKSEAGLVEALVAARKATLAAKVNAGAITQAQADAALPTLVKRVTAEVNRARPQHTQNIR
jgi:energy-converting hydrogenase Eha subunit B